MPRIFDRANNPFDFCKACFPDESKARKKYGSRFRGSGPDGRGNCFSWDAEHPPYEDLDYQCQTCDKLLEENDNDIKE